MALTPELFCPEHAQKLSRQVDKYLCESGCHYPIVNGIPRFVPQDNYASSFGLQWNRYRMTQLDSHTGVSISRDRLTRMFGGSLDALKGKSVLEAGCGAGRFSEIMLKAGANLISVDLSSAVDANLENCKQYPNHSVIQASILKLPFPKATFDVVVCVGVIQHTPNPEETMTALCAQLKPGGLLVIDHYSPDYPTTPSRAALRAVLLKSPPKVSLRVVETLTNVLWPIHAFAWKNRTRRGFKRLRPYFLKLSPIVDYQDAYPQLGPDALKVWASLDTHDTLTDFYKHLRNSDEIQAHLSQCGMVDIHTAYAGNGVEAYARKA